MSYFAIIIFSLCGGTCISKKIYNMYNTQNFKYESIINKTKSFEEILDIQTKEYIQNINKYNYDYDNEHGNTVEIIDI